MTESVEADKLTSSVSPEPAGRSEASGPPPRISSLARLDPNLLALILGLLTLFGGIYYYSLSQIEKLQDQVSDINMKLVELKVAADANTHDLERTRSEIETWYRDDLAPEICRSQNMDFPDPWHCISKEDQLRSFYLRPVFRDARP